MKKYFKIVILLFALMVFLLICGILSLLFGITALENYQAERFFTAHQSEFEVAASEIRAINCPKSFVTHKEIAQKEFDVFVDCDKLSIVFETSALFGGRVDLVNISSDSKIKLVDECSDENGNYEKKLVDKWHLCRGDLL